MNIMTVEQIAKSYGEKILFKDASFGMADQDKIGVVGVNGTGKSTFLRVISGMEPADAGQISIGNDVRIQFLAQIRTSIRIIPYCSKYSKVTAWK